MKERTSLKGRRGELNLEANHLHEEERRVVKRRKRSPRLASRAEGGGEGEGEVAILAAVVFHHNDFNGVLASKLRVILVRKHAHAHPQWQMAYFPPLANLNSFSAISRGRSPKAKEIFAEPRKSQFISLNSLALACA